MNVKTGGTYNTPFNDRPNIRKTKNVKLRYRADRPTVTGRIYKQEVLKKALDKSIDRTLYVVRNYSDVADNNNCVCFNDIIGIVENYNIQKDGSIELYIKPICDTELFDGNYQLNTIGIGRIDVNNYVKEFAIIALYLAENKDYLLELK